MSDSFNWQTRPIFISSTFKDMGAERDYLRQTVFPELEERLRERRCHLEPIDLRWGVETINMDDEQSKEILVLKVCLGEIERSKPYLVALIGDRYGWMPPIDRMETAAMEAGFKGNISKKSITALELEYGVFNNPEQQVRSFFYLREPLPYDIMPPEMVADYCDKYNPDPQAAVAARNLDELKEHLRKEKKLEGRIKSYSVVWDKENNRVTGLDSFGKMVLEDLWSDLKDETKEYMCHPTIEWEELERQMLEEFIEARTLNFAGRGELISEIIEQTLNQELNNKGSAICLTGQAGSGKSAVFAYLFRQLEKRKIILLANSAGAGFRSANINDVLIRWIGELIEKQNISNPLPESPSTEDVDAVFQDLLAGASKNNRVVILMDALNQMGKSTRMSYMQWLPQYLPSGCRMIVTGIPCLATNTLLKKEWVKNLELPNLEKSDAEEIALSICRRYHRTLNQEVLALLLNKEVEKDLPAFSSPLWMKMAVEELNLLDMDAFSLAERKYNGNSEQKLHQLLLDTASDMPPGVEELYQWIFNRAEKVFGRSLVENCLSLIAVSRKGWRESDLQFVVPRLSGSPWNELSFSGLKRSLRAHLTCLGNYRLINFEHSQMKKAVIESYLTDEKKIKNLHMQVEIHMMSSPGDPIASSERMYHLICLKNVHEIAEYYGGMFSSENKDSDHTLAEFIYNGPTEELDNRMKFALEILQEPSLFLTKKIRLIGKYLYNLPNAIGYHLDLKSKRKYYEAILNFLEEQAMIYPEMDILRFYRSQCHKEIGNILLTTGDLQNALNSFVVSQQISESLLQTGPENRLFKWALSKNLIYIGEVLYEKRDLEGALKAQKASLEIAESLALSNPDDFSLQRHLAMIHVNIGATLRALGNNLSAEKSTRNGLEITESCYKNNPDKTDILHDLMQCHCHLVEILVERGDLSDGLEECRKSIEFAESSVRIYPGDLNIQRDLSVCYEKLGDVMYEKGRLQEAMEAYRKSKGIAELNAISDPANIIWQIDLVLNLEKTGKVLEATGDNFGSLQAYQASLKIRKELCLALPDKPDLQKDLASNYRKIGDILLKSGEFLNAQDSFYKSLNIIKSLSGKDPANLKLQLDLALANYRVGYALSTTFVSEAKNYYRSCLDMLLSLEAKGFNLETSVISLKKELENKIK